jgi:protease I
VLYVVCTGNPTEKPFLEPVIASAPAASPAIRRIDDIRTKRVVLIVASKYFDDTEYFGAGEKLQTVGIQPVIASLVTGEVKGIERNTIIATMLVKDIKADDYDAFVFIGGSGAREYFSNRDVLNLVRLANEKKKILAAIGTAPAVFASADIVKGRNVTSSTAQRRKLLLAGAEWKNSSIEINGNMITASGPEADRLEVGSSESAQRFGTAILSMLRQQNQ